MESWKRNQGHYQAQLEMLNPQRTLERGYAVILTKGVKTQAQAQSQAMHAVRNPKELNTQEAFQVRLAEGQVEVAFSKIEAN